MRKRSFRLKLAVSTLVLVALPLAVVGWLVLDVNRRALEDETRDRLFAIIDDIGHTVDGAIADAELGVTAVTRVLADESLTTDQRLGLAASLVEATPAVRAVGIYDGTGARIDVLAEAGAIEPVPVALAADVTARATAGPLLLPAVPSPEGPRVVLVVPIRGAQATWFAAAPIALDGLQERVERITRDHLGERPDALVVVDRNHRVIAHSDPELAEASPVMPDEGVLATLATGDVGDGAVLVYGEYGSQVSAARSLERAPWIVVAQRPRAEVFASLAATRRTVIAGIAVALLVALALALFASARLARPIQALVAYAGDLAHRRWDRRVQLQTGDELEELAVAMSGAAAQLQESEERIARERRLRGDLGRYLPAQLVEKLARGDQDLRLGGEQRTITVLFADVASFTSLVERKSPEEVTTILNQLFTILTEVVFRHGGTVDKFIGDCVMAFWGAPAPSPDHAARAVDAAQAMLRWLELGNEAWQAEHGVTLHLSIGVHSGPAIVGNFGSEARMEYTAVGDTVNIAARLEALARPQQILVSSATRDAAPRAECVPAGAYQVPGRRDPVLLHEVMWR